MVIKEKKQTNELVENGLKAFSVLKSRTHTHKERSTNGWKHWENGVFTPFPR